MRIKEVLTNYELCLVDLAVMLNGKNDPRQRYALDMAER